MKKLALFCAVSVSVFLSANAFAGSAEGGIGVQAAVQGECSVTASALMFGVYDPIAVSTATSNIEVNCTAGITYWLEMDSGHYTANTVCPGFRAMSNGVPAPFTGFLCYEIFDPATTFVWGTANDGSLHDLAADVGMAYIWGPEVGGPLGIPGVGGPQPFTADGVIPLGQVVPPGTYNDVVTLYVDW